MRFELEQKVKEWKTAERPLVEELQNAGYSVESAWDFVNWRGPPYEAAIPILLKHLNAEYPERVREGIARSLGRKFARNEALDAVIRMYQTTPNLPQWQFKDALAVAIQSMAARSDVRQLIQLLNDPSNGPSRIFFIKNLMRSKTEEARNALILNQADPDLRKEIEFRLGRKAAQQ